MRRIMITEVVTFPIRKDLTREQVVELYKSAVPAPRANPELVHESYLYDAERNRGGGIYVWKTIDAAKRRHDSEWCARMAQIFGGEPTFEYFETPIINDYAARLE